MEELYKSVVCLRCIRKMAKCRGLDSRRRQILDQHRAGGKSLIPEGADRLLGVKVGSVRRRESPIAVRRATAPERLDRCGAAFHGDVECRDSLSVGILILPGTLNQR